MGCVATLALAACASAPAGTTITPSFETFAALDRPAAIIARDASEIPDAAAAAAAFADAAARDGRRIEVSAAPFLYAAPIGRRFRESPLSRALARGAPEATCPGVGLGAAGTPREAAREALAACFADLAAERAPPDCACRVLAVDGALAGPREDFAYASGVSARLVGEARGADRLLIAEETDAPDGRARRVVLSDAAGPVGVADLGPGDRARLGVIGGGVIYEGRREALGWRRGRLAERLLLEGPDGRRLIALIGVEPSEMATRGEALTRWPG